MFSDSSWGANGEAAMVVNLEALLPWLSFLGEIVMSASFHRFKLFE
jgi:hypothetical protein